MFNNIRKIFSTTAILFLTFLVPATIFSASPRNAKELIPAGSWVYDSLSLLATENGTVDFSDDAPLSVSQIRIYLKSYDYDSLSENAKSHYDKIIAYFDEENISFYAGLFSLGLEPKINLEGYFKGNEKLDWTYDRFSRQEFLTIPATFDIGDYLTMQTDLAFAQNKGWMAHNDNYVNIPLAAGAVDVHFPSSGYISTGIDLPKDCQVNFRLGLGQQSVGRTLMGSIILSDYLTGTSWANLEFFSPNFKYNLNITEFNVNKYLYSHRLDVRFFDKFHFSAMEGILVNAPIELKYFNPWTIYHGMAPWLDYSGEAYYEGYTCAYMCFKAAYTPIKNLRIYGLYAQDQFQTQYERDNWPDDTTPNGIGFQVGIEGFIPFKDGNFHLWAEGYYADPYLYIKEDPNWSMVRTYRENIGDKATFFDWIGTPFGPDTIAAQLNVEYEVAKKWNVGLSYLFKAAGEYSGSKIFTPELSWGGHDTSTNGAAWVYPNPDTQGYDEAKRRQGLISPSGTPEYMNRISLSGSYNFNDFLNLGLQGAFVFSFNHGNKLDNFQCGPEITASLHFDFTKLYRRLVDDKFGKKDNQNEEE